jgi:hypothetical protein
MTEETGEDEPTPERNWRALLMVAGELQRWVNSMPIWREQSTESWAEYSRRHMTREQELTAKLHRMPGCTLKRSTNGSATTLLLAGIEVRSLGGPAAACKDWITTVRRLAPKLPPATG